MSTKPKTLVTPHEYLALEREAHDKSEYYAGEVFALAGASPRHNLIAGNVLAALHRQLKDRDYRVFPSDLRVEVPDIPYYTYPDVSVLCGDWQIEDEHRDNLLNPIVLVEVLSPATQRRDRGSKFESYRRIESLREYVLIAQDKQSVEQCCKQSDGSWIFSETSGGDALISLKSIGCELTFTDIYEKVVL